MTHDSCLVKWLWRLVETGAVETDDPPLSRVRDAVKAMDGEEINWVAIDVRSGDRDGGVQPINSYARSTSLLRCRSLPVKSPHPRAALRVREDIAECLHLVPAAGDRLSPGPFGPQASFFRAKAVLANGVRCMFFGEADPMPRVVISEAGQHMKMLGIHGSNQHVDAVARQAFRNGISNELTQLARDAHRIPLHQSLRELVKLVVFTLGRGILVIAIHMFAMMERAPSARIAAQP